MLKKLVIGSLLILSSAVLISAQSVHTPEKGSPERKAILDALRVPVERDLKQKIVFVTDKFNVLGSWAFISGRPTKPDGSDPDLAGTEWDGADPDAYDNNFFALLRKTGGKWKVVKHALGCTDVCYAEWWKEARAPKAIFDMNY